MNIDNKRQHNNDKEESSSNETTIINQLYIAVSKSIDFKLLLII